LKAQKKIRKKIVVIGDGKIEDVVTKGTDVERKRIDDIEEVAKYKDIDEIVICEKIPNDKDINFLLYLFEKLKKNVVFSPSIYTELLSEKVNGDNSLHFLRTFIGNKSDLEEFLIRSMDIAGSLLILFISAPIIVLASLLTKITSPGPTLYKQQRIGKDGKIFTLYKFRTMIKDAERISGFSPAMENDSRITKIGRFLRKTRSDELPQLWNVLKGEMSLVGPRPENLYRVKAHEALQGLRLAVKPGLTGLAQIRSFYDLHPKHKIRYDYLYIQKRSLLLNLYLLLRTIPVVLSKKGQ
jgi:lipopolysaccharide/colanic/teichoic acid biosynthesis glycosyltransferase